MMLRCSRSPFPPGEGSRNTRKKVTQMGNVEKSTGLLHENSAVENSDPADVALGLLVF